MSTTQRMGRGLDALWGGAEPLAEVGNTKPNTLDISTIFPNPNQPRKNFSKESLEELANSITQQGIIQPLLVRPSKDGKGYELVAGERRFRAAKIAGLKEVPVFIRDLDDEAVMAAALIENIQRENLSPIEEANALFRLREECGITQEELATRLGKSRSAIANALRLLQLSTAAQEDVQQGNLSAGHARALLSLAPDEDAQEKLRKAIAQHNLSVRDTEAAANNYKEKAQFPWENTSTASMNSENNSDSLAAEKEDNTESIEREEPKTTAKSSNRTKPEYLQHVQSKIKEQLEVKASISGNEQRGRITLTYTNADELNQILQTLGIQE